MNLSVVIPCFNECSTIHQVIEAVKAVQISAITAIELIVVDYGAMIARSINILNNRADVVFSFRYVQTQ